MERRVLNDSLAKGKEWKVLNGKQINGVKTKAEENKQTKKNDGGYSHLQGCLGIGDPYDTVRVLQSLHTKNFFRALQYFSACFSLWQSSEAPSAT